MSELVLIGLAEERAAILDDLQRAGVIEIVESKPESLLAEPNPSMQKREEHVLQLQSRQDRIEQFLQALKQRFPEEGKGREETDLDALMASREDADEMVALMDRYEAIEEEARQLRAEQDRLQSEQALLAPWKDLAFDLHSRSTERCSLFVGTLSAAEKFEQLRQRCEEELPETAFAVLQKGEHGVQLIAATLKEQQAKLRMMLSSADFASLPVYQEGELPAERLETNAARIKELQAKREALAAEQARMAKERPALKRLSDAYALMIAKAEAGRLLYESSQAFALKGWTPSEGAEALVKRLETRFNCHLVLRESDRTERFPILLRNKPFSRAFEVILEMFGAPHSQEADPTPVMGFFYFIIFGMMLSDVGYGAILTLVCWHFLRKGIEGEGRKMVSMLFFSGISSVAWGFVFGGFFGNLLTAVSQGAVNFPTLWFNPMDDPMKMLGFSMFFGLIHLFFGMGMDIYNKVQMGQTFDALVDVVPWYFILTGAGLLAVPGMPTLTMVAKGMMIFGAAVIILFGGRSSKNPLLRLARGILKLYDITGFLSDVLSYSRILALVLATSVIAMVVNELGTMGGHSVPGYLLLLGVGLFGHTLNLGLSALSAYVHDSRLQYVEFFGKFYQNGGRFWKPLKDTTKHFRLRKDQGEPLEKQRTTQPEG